MHYTMNINEVKFELTQLITNEINQITRDFEITQKINIKPVIYFSPDLRVIAVNLEHVSQTPFFMNVEILRNLENAILYFGTHQKLESKGYKVIEHGAVDANSLNVISRLHPQNRPLAYQTNNAFMFSTSQDNVNKLLVKISDQINKCKETPSYIEKIEMLSPTKNTPSVSGLSDFNFQAPSKINQFQLHEQKVFSCLFDDYNQDQILRKSSMEPITHTNRLVMGYTVNLSKGAQKGILHIPMQFLEHITPHASARHWGSESNQGFFNYYNWLVGEDKVVQMLQANGANIGYEYVVDYLKSYKRHDVSINSIEIHQTDFEIPTSNFAQINRIGFVGVWEASNGFPEYFLVQMQADGDIRFFNSRMLAIYPPDDASSCLNDLKVLSSKLFVNNRLYAFEQINQFRKSLGGYNSGLFQSKNYIYIA